jgi:signal transduction histidine kinase
MVVSTAQIFFYENERLELIDQRLETIASTLIATGLSLDMIEKIESTDDLINELLGEEKIDQIINVYNLKGKILVKNLTAAEVYIPFNRDSHWQNYETGDRTIRILNIVHGKLVVQIGVILNLSFKQWTAFNSRIGVFAGLVFCLLLLIAYFSSGVLFNPLKRLTKEVEEMSRQLEHKMGQPLSGFIVGPEWMKLSKGRTRSKDEFEILCAEIESFLKKLETYTKSFHAQTALLTHELKTPLTILRNYLEEAKKSKNLEEINSCINFALSELASLVSLINDYLQWSVLTSNPANPDLFAYKLSDVLSKIVADLNYMNSNRIQINGVSDTTVFASPNHLNQLISNLLTNALNYSPKDSTVTCELNNDTIIINDSGPGIPKEVLANLGNPFNRNYANLSRAQKGSGLGLAWVQALCDKYKWKLDIRSTAEGTQIKVRISRSEEYAHE